MNVIDAVLCADVIEDAKLEGGITKVRATLNKNYGRIRSEGFGVDDGYDWETGRYKDSAPYTETQPPEYVELGEEGLPGIPVMG
jgi:hypothetical protein